MIVTRRDFVRTSAALACLPPGQAFVYVFEEVQP